MNLEQIECKIDRQRLYQQIGKDKDKFSGESWLISKEWAKIRNSALSLVGDGDLVFETEDKVISVSF